MENGNLIFTASVWQEGKHFVAKCVELGVASFGDDRDEALVNLREAVELYLEDDIPSKPMIINSIPPVSTGGA